MDDYSSVHINGETANEISGRMKNCPTEAHAQRTVIRVMQLSENSERLHLKNLQLYYSIHK